MFTNGMFGLWRTHVDGHIVARRATAGVPLRPSDPLHLMKTLSRALALASAAIAFAVAPSVAAAQAPNLSGEWELDVAASTFGPRPGPQKQILKIEHADPSLKTTTTSTTERGERTQSSAYTTDGAESKNTGAMGNETVSLVKWDGGALAMTSKLSMQGQEITINEKWTVSDGGKTLTVARTASTPMGELQTTMVYHKKG